MKKISFSVEETRTATYTITIDIKNKDAKAFDEGEISEEELKEMYEDKIDEATADQAPEGGEFEVDNRWIEFESMED